MTVFQAAAILKKHLEGKRETSKVGRYAVELATGEVLKISEAMQPKGAYRFRVSRNNGSIEIEEVD